MMLIFALITLLSLFVLELIYFKVADRFNIIDKPNHRSSHQTVTIRGGGIIFSLAIVIFFLFFNFQYPYFVTGLLLISAVSFLDDILTLDNKLRLVIHFLAVGLMFYEWQLFTDYLVWLPVALILVIGTINAYNFMDGINGITGGYSFLAIACLYFINYNTVNFISADLLFVSGLSLLVFIFFNFRKQAKCFAGDVGSIAIAYTLVFIIGQLILFTGNFNYVLLLAVYGLDAVSTILFRLIRKENIFEAHRSHFYQFLANDRKLSHLTVSALYILVQLLINIYLIFYMPENLMSALLLLTVLILGFLFLRFKIEGPQKLFGEWLS